MNSVEQFYHQDQHDEWGRFDRHRTEFAITLRALAEFLPPPPAQILDVGGGPGRYAIELTKQGYAVTLVDLAQGNLERARANALAADVTLTGIQHGNALDLSCIADSTYDAVLLMGPLYHLFTQQERVQAVAEAHRVLKPGGLIFAAFITLFAQLRFWARVNPTWLLEYRDYAERSLRTGIHEPHLGFTDAYFAHPNEVIPLLEKGGFSTLRLLGSEGVVAGMEDLVNQLTGEAWALWVDLNYRLGQDSALYGASDHLLYIGRKAHDN
ncbi:MAG: methyltransferase domain-containing protein [Caldilineaceae bacterium]